MAEPESGSESTKRESARRLPAARRRTQLLGVALEAFGSKGYHGTSMDEVAEAAGVTKPVLYQHFPSKRALYLELIRSTGDDLLEAIAESATAQPDPHARVLAGFDAYFKFVRAKTNAFRLLFGGDARQQGDFAAAVQDAEGKIALAIAHLIDVDLPEEDREILAYAIIGLAEVTSRQWLLRSEAAGERELAAEEAARLALRLTDFVWAGLRGLPEPASHEAG